MTREIRDRSGNLMLRIFPDGTVRAPSGELLGSIRDGKTYGPNGAIVCEGEVPGLLLGASKGG